MNASLHPFQMIRHTPRSFLSAVALTLWLSIICAADERQDVLASGAGPSERIDLRLQGIIQRINANYSRLPPLEATVQTITTSPEVPAKRVTTSQLGGTTFTITESPRTVGTSRILLDGPNYRWDETGGLHNTWIFKDGFWTEYEPHMNRLSMRAREHLPGRSPLDPRDVGSTSLKERFVDQLARSRVVSEPVPEYTIEETELLLEIRQGKAKGMRYRCVFDHQKEMLPVNVEYQMSDGTKNIVINIAYQGIQEHSAWFPAMCVVTFPKSGGQTRTTRIKHIQFLEQTTGDAFDLQVPSGTLVSDYLRQETSRKE